jgi:hypothetical protein
MSQPFVVSQGIHSREWVGAFSPLKNGSCIERLVQDLAVAEPQLGNLSASSLYKFYSNFVSQGEVLLEILGDENEEEEEEEEGALTKRANGDDEDKTLRQEQQSRKIFRRTFVSEAAMQLTRLDREYRRRLGTEAGSRKRKVGLSFADDTGAGSALDGNWEAAVEDEQETEETLEEDNMYRTKKRVTAARPPKPHLATAETLLSPSTSPSSSSSTTALPSIILQQNAEIHQRHQGKHVANDHIGLDRGRSAATFYADPAPSIAFSSETYNDDKVTANQLSQTLENTEREQSHLSKALANLREMLAQSRQQQQARFFFPNAHSASNSHLDEGRVVTKARTTATTTIFDPAGPILQPQQQPNLSHLDRSSASTPPSSYTNMPALADNNSSATCSKANTLAAANAPHTANCTSASNSLLEEAIRSFGQDLKIQVTSLKSAFENQQLQMIHLQEAVETQQTQLTAIQDTLNILVRQSIPSNIYHQQSEKVKEAIGMSPISGDLAMMETAPAVQAIPAASPPAVQTAPIVPPLPATRTAATTSAKSPETERTQPGTAPTQVRRRIRQKYKLSTPAIPAYVSTTQQQNSRSLKHVDSNTEAASSALGAGSVVPTTATVELSLAQAGAPSYAAATAASIPFVRPNLYRSTSQPLRPPPEFLGADSLAKSTWNLDMLVISELAAAAVVDLDRQLTVEQQLQQLQSPLSLVSTPIGEEVDLGLEP